jgi:hypothetical protein
LIRSHSFRELSLSHHGGTPLLGFFTEAVIVIDVLSLQRVSSANVLDEGLRIEGRGRRMNSKVKIQTNKAKLDVS